MNSGVKNEYLIMDILKLLFAVLILCNHFLSGNHAPQLIKLCVSFSAAAVPFFIACSAMLVSHKGAAGGDYGPVVGRQCRRIWIMYGLWSIVYILFRTGAFIVGKASAADVIHYIHTSVVWSTYSTIWFLPALAIGLWLAHICIDRKGIRFAAVLAAAVYIICIFGYSYNFLVQGTPAGRVYDIYNMIFGTVRNGVFIGFPFAVLGRLAGTVDFSKIHPGKYILLSAVWAVLFTAEAFVLKYFGSREGAETLLCHIPLTWCLLMLSVSVVTERTACLKAVREYSTLIFLSQRILLTAVPALFPVFFAGLYGNWMIGLAIVLIGTAVISTVIRIIGRGNATVRLMY